MTQSLLIRSLQNPRLYNHPITKFRVIETHISWVILTGEYAYKVKKPMEFPFADFSTLEKRKYFCYEEITRNRLLAPDVYTDVVPIYGTRENPNFNEEGELIEYAIRMVEFPQSNLFDRRLQVGELTGGEVEEAAIALAHFHQRIDKVPDDSEYGEYEKLHKPICDNFTQIRPHLTEQKDVERLDAISVWAEVEHERLKAAFLERKAAGKVKQCHGDAHLGNITLWKGKPIFFDCIEFNRSFCWTDVMGDLGFFAMDLEDKGRWDLAARAVNRYMIETGDYDALSVLTYYKAYRAMVRAKVSLMYQAQDELGAEQRAGAWAKYRSCAKLVFRYTKPRTPMLIVTHGLSGSGKSTVAKQLVEQFSAVQLRSDVERKRLFGYKPLEDTGSGLNENIYTEECYEKTYQKLTALAETVVKAGFTAVVDAACLRQRERECFRKVAEKLQIPFWIVSCEADKALLEKRIKERKEKQSDPSEAARAGVLEWQLEAIEPLTEQERQQAIHLDMSQPLEPIKLEQHLFCYLRASHNRTCVV